MIDCIIWSKDRPMQLALLLESIKVNANWVDPTIILKSSNENYSRAYSKVKEEFADYKYIEQDAHASFNAATWFAINETDSPYLCFACDDNVLYREQLNSPGEVLAQFPEISCFSLRLGYNTIVQNPLTKIEQHPLKTVLHPDKDVIAWDVRDYHPQSNYGYPLALDFHIYRRKMITELMREIEFNNTNELEGRLQTLRDRCGWMMASYERSMSVNVPLTNASGLTDSIGFTNEELNIQFLDGKRISLEAISKQTILGCHQFISPEFV